VRCPELSLSEEDARRAVDELIAGADGPLAKRVLADCASCFSCNTYCPTDAGPYYLVLSRFNDLYKRRGASPIYRYVCPNMKQNAWSTLNVLASPGERGAFSRWHRDLERPGKRPLVIGNYAHLFPHIFESPLFDSFTLLDPIEHWESGAYLTQAGYIEVVREIGEAVRPFYDELASGETTPFLLTDSVILLMTRIFPDNYRLTEEPISFTHWLSDELWSGRIELTEKISLRLAVHDNCYAKVEGDSLFDAVRAILADTGAEVVELAHNRCDSLCCGFGRGAADIPKVSVPFKIMKGAMRKLAEAEESGADGLVTYCTGCMYLLWSARELTGSRLGVYHLVEPVTMAMGAYPYDDLARQRERAWDIIAQITYFYIKSLFQSRFFIGDVKKSEYRPDHVPSLPLLSFLRIILSFSPVRRIFALGFRWMTKLF
jgi:heterodisulfide reductase subunit B